MQVITKEYNHIIQISHEEITYIFFKEAVEKISHPNPSDIKSME